MLVQVNQQIISILEAVHGIKMLPLWDYFADMIINMLIHYNLLPDLEELIIGLSMSNVLSRGLTTLFPLLETLLSNDAHQPHQLSISGFYCFMLNPALEAMVDQLCEKVPKVNALCGTN